MAGIRMENKIYEVGMYCRLSKDDGTDNESASIATQKSILTDYVKKQGWHLAKTYVDDGYSGTNFQRPSFQNMIKDIESGLINCVITKDLSRLGRNYLDCGLYLEVFFPEHNVRYIAVNDGVDTLNKSAMDITPFRNILNEMYSADVSVKIKSAYRARFQQGKFMGTTAPYGYVKDPADHNHLLIDDKVAHVVREIFDLALAGNGIAKIRKHINKQHILRPAAYAAEQGATGYERYFEENEENRYIWSENSVRGILRSPIYAGNLAGYKRIAANMKSKKRPSKLPEEWEVIRHQFDRLCQMALKGEAVNYYKHMDYRRKHEVTFSELSEKELSKLFTMDEYGTEYHHFEVHGYDIEVKNTLIAEALKELTERKRNVILLSYFMEMSDADIAREMNLVRSTIHEHRTHL